MPEKSFSFLIRFFVFFAVLALLPNTTFATGRSVPFYVGETIDPGLTSEACGPTDSNCFPSITSIRPIGTSTGQTGQMNFLELATNGTNTVGFRAPDSITASVQWTLPNADGTNGQILTTNGSGVLSWLSISASSSGAVILNGLSSTTQSFATTSDTNIGLSIISSGTTHTFIPTWTGTLSASRGGTGTSTIGANQLLIGNSSGTDWTQISTSSLYSMFGVSTAYSLNGISTTTQTFATGTDTNIGLSIVSSGSIHTLTPTWTGTLSAGRGGTGTSTIGANKLLIGNSAGTDWTQVSTTSFYSTLQIPWTSGNNISTNNSGTVTFSNNSDVNFTNAGNVNFFNSGDVNFSGSGGVNYNVTGNIGLKGLTVSNGVSDPADVWIDVPVGTSYASGIGSGGPGGNAWIAYAGFAGAYFSDSTEGDIAYRNSSGKLLYGTTGGNADFSINTDGSVGVGTSTQSGQKFTVDGNTKLVGNLTVTGSSSLATTSVTNLSISANTLTSGNALNISAISLNNGAAAKITTASGLTALSVLGNILPQYSPSSASTTGTQVVTTVESTNSVGSTSSMTIGLDGYPIISYYDATNGDLRVYKCSNILCTSGSSVAVDTTGDVGAYSAIAMPPDGLPVIAYYSTTAGDLKYVKCGNTSCSSGNTINTIESTNNVGQSPSIAIGDDTFALISYFDVTNTGLRVAKCSNSTCSSSTITSVDTSAGRYSSVKIGADGFPIISYYHSGTQDLKMARCINTSCTNGSLSSLDTTGNVGLANSIIIPADGKPIISYVDGTGSNLKVLKCNDVTCSGSTITTVDSSAAVGQATSMALGSDGNPVIAYFRSGTSDLYIAKCTNATCTASTLIAADTTNVTGLNPSIAIGSDGLPVISYYYSTGADLRVYKCSDVNCASASTYENIGGSDIGSRFSYFNNIYASQLWGKKLTVANFDLAENYKTADDSLGAGDVVSIDKDGLLVRAGSNKAVKIIGVISTAPGLLLSNWTDEGSLYRPVALSGRVPVKITESVKAGDSLTFSTSTPGYARKSNNGETSIGYALSDSSDGTVEMFARLDFKDNSSDLLNQINSSLNSLASVHSANVSTASTSTDVSFVGKFFSNLSAWLSDVSNGIDSIVARVFRSEEVQTNKLCVGKVCVTEEELGKIMSTYASSTPNLSTSTAGTSITTNTSSSTSSSTATTTDSMNSTSTTTVNTASTTSSTSTDNINNTNSSDTSNSSSTSNTTENTSNQPINLDSTASSSNI